MDSRTYNQNALRTWVDIDTKALLHNYDLFCSLLSDKTSLCAVVKSNAYGHSIIDYAKEVEKLGADWIAVDTLVEGLKLREAGIKAPILVLGYTLPEMYKKAASHNISITIAGMAGLKEACMYTGSKPLKVHLKADTGMHRQGFFERDFPSVLKQFSKSKTKKLRLEGFYTHFPNAKNPSEPAYTRGQLEIFERIRVMVNKAGHTPLIHAAATSGTIIFPESHFDMVRVGIGLYGLWPSAQTKHYAEDWLPLQPILSWKSIVSDVKKVPRGAQFGYGLTESVSRDSKVAVVPVGYWHGYPRALSSIGQVLIRGKRAKVLGTVSMDIMVVDVTDIKGVKTGDTVTLIGKDKKDAVTADELAGMTDTIPYEIVTRINPLIKRFYL